MVLGSVPQRAHFLEDLTPSRHIKLDIRNGKKLQGAQKEGWVFQTSDPDRSASTGKLL